MRPRRLTIGCAIRASTAAIRGGYGGRRYVSPSDPAKKEIAMKLVSSAESSSRDRVYFDPAVKQALADGLRALGQFAYG